MAMGGEKAQNFGANAKRLMGRLGPERALVTVVIVLAVASVALTAVGPKILGHATNLIFEGFFSAQMPAGDGHGGNHFRAGAEDAAVHGIEEMLILQQRGDAVVGFVVEENGAELIRLGGQQLRCGGGSDAASRA